MLIFKRLICGIILITGSYCFAADTASNKVFDKPISKPQAKQCKKCCKNPCKVIIAPYLWSMNMNGFVNVGTRSVRVRQTFSDILENMQGGGMLYVEVDKGKWGVFLNSMYAYLDKIYYINNVPIKPVFEFGMFTGGISYEIFKRCFCQSMSFAVTPYLGARYTLTDVQIKVVHTSIQAGSNQDWIDAIIGTKLNYGMNKNWSLLFAGDIGGRDSNQKSYNMNGYIGYRPDYKCVDLTIYGGYRYMYQKYVNNSESNQYVWKMHMFGPVIGLAFAF
jgi:hypothetical protein